MYTIPTTTIFNMYNEVLKSVNNRNHLILIFFTNPYTVKPRPIRKPAIIIMSNISAKRFISTMIPSGDSRDPQGSTNTKNKKITKNAIRNFV